jgi:hypothetical protein
MEPKLWLALRQFFEWHIVQRPWSRQRVKLIRWLYVREGIDRHKLAVQRACKYASTELNGSPAQAGSKAMEADYYEIEHKRRASQSTV